METLELIKAYGLSVRQIPLKIVSVYAMRHFKVGDTIVRRRVKDKVNGTWEWVEKDYCERTEIPKYAGYWMCQQSVNTSSRVQWSLEYDNLAPTLEESVNLFIANYEYHEKAREQSEGVPILGECPPKPRFHYT